MPKGKYEVGYRDRLKAMLLGLANGARVLEIQSLMIHAIPTRVVKSLEDAMAHYRELLAKGKEGTIIKNGNAIWKNGTSKEQIKLKLEVDVDLIIKGIAEGRAGTIFGSDQAPCRYPPRTAVRISTQHLRSKEQAVTRSHSPTRFDPPGDEQHRSTVDAIRDRGWSEQDNLFPPDLTLALALECAALATAGTLTLALVGQGAARSLQPDVRGDRIQRLDAGQSESRDRYLATMEMLRIALNRGSFWDSKNTKATSHTTPRAHRISDTAINFAMTIAARVRHRLSECGLAA